MKARCLDANTIAGYLDGALEADASRRVDAHIDECIVCRTELSALVANGSQPAPRMVDESGLHAEGDQIGRYRVLRHHASGGMGVILIAHDPELDREVALKLLRPEIADRERLQQEGRAMARLAHPNVVRVYDVIDDEDQLAVAMEYVVGQDLGAWVRQQTRPWREVVQTCIAAGRGLAGAHAAGLVHRDFKPENVLVAEDGRVLVTDFGLASAAGGDETARRVFAGTPRYMAPELHTGAQAATAASDEFSFCVTVWQALFGEMPYPGSSWDEVSRRARAGDLAPAPRSAVPARIRAALARGLSPDPAARFGSMEALLAALNPGGPRRWQVVAAAAGVAATAVALVVASSGDERPSCEVAAGALRGAWDSDVDARIHGAFVATGHPRGAAIADRASARLQRYADAWRTARTDACMATQTGEQSPAVLDLRMQCLDRRRQELAALTELFAEDPDTKVLDRATAAVDQLAGVETCSADQAGTRAPLPDDPVRRMQIEVARATQARAEALRLAGRAKDAAAILVEVGARARATNYSPLIVDVAQSLGAAYTSLSRFDESEKVLFEALESAEASADHVAAAVAWIGLLSAVGAQQQKGETADVYAKAARAKLAAFNANEALRGRFAYVLATVETARGRYKEALTHLEEARKHFAKHYGPNHATAGDVEGALCMVHQKLGALDEAARACARAVAIHDKLSPDDPDTAYTVNIYASVLLAQNRADDAVVQYRRAIEIADRTVGPQSLVRALALNNLAVIHRRRGEYDKALEDARASLAAFEKYHPDHPQMSTALTTIANTLIAQGEKDEGIRYLERGRALVVAKLGADHPQVATADYNIATVYVDRGEYARAKPLLERALETSRRSLGANSKLAAYILSARAVIAKHEKRPREAVQLAGEAVVILEKLLGPDHPEVATALGTLGDARLEAGDARGAVEPLTRAVRLQASGGEPQPRAIAHFDLARALWQAGSDRKQALQHAREARELVATVKTADELRTRIDRWLRARERR